MPFISSEQASDVSTLLTYPPSRIKEGQFYEAHQQLRVIASRYVKQSNWSAAVDILYGGAKSLLEAAQGGSGGDLCLFLVDVYNKAETTPDASSKGKLLTLLRSFPAGEPTRKKFIGELISYVPPFRFSCVRKGGRERVGFLVLSIATDPSAWCFLDGLRGLENFLLGTRSCTMLRERSMRLVRQHLS